MTREEIYDYLTFSWGYDVRERLEKLRSSRRNSKESDGKPAPIASLVEKQTSPNAIESH